MSTRTVARPARQVPVEPDGTPVRVVSPPAVPDGRGGLAGSLQVLLPILACGGSVLIFLSNRNPLFLVAGLAMLTATVLGGILLFVSRRTGANRRLALRRRRYLDHLDGIRDLLHETGVRQRAAARHRHPDPATLADLVADPHRLWERRPRDPDFGVVRVGLGPDRLSRPVGLQPAADPLVEPDPVTLAAAEQLLARHAALGNMPVTVPLRGVVSVVGPPADTRALLRALVAQLVTLHAPDDVRLAWCLGPAALPGYDWVKWLPHCLDPDGWDGPAPRRLVARDGAELAALLARADTDRLVLVVDQATAGRVALPPDLRCAVVVVPDRAQEPSTVDVRVTCAGGAVEVTGAAGAPSGRIDPVPVARLETLARRLAPLRCTPDTAAGAPLETTVDLRGLLRVDDEAGYDVRERWRPRSRADFLTVPFGVGPDGRPVLLDLKESAQGGMGPHGLCVGATGSGKSEVLRTLLLSLAMTHPPERLALVLVDYKGGATFAGLEALPHTSAMVSNLAAGAGLPRRLHDALFGELRRRQQILADAGNLPDSTAYNRRRDAGEPLPPLPNLMVVIDEFGELLTAEPDFLELFLAIGRIGRSIGIHLLLASQRLEEGKLRGLETYLSYRIGLRTFTEQESRTVLGVGDAYLLPPDPGSGYLKVDTTVFRRFKAAYVSGPHQPPARGDTVDAAPVAVPYLLGNRGPAPARAVSGADADGPSTLDVVVGRLHRAGTRAHQVWLPPLPAALPLDAVRGPAGGLRIPLGLLDRPAEQRQEPLTVDLAGSGGHLAVLGAPMTGKSTTLRTLVAAAALTHTPAELAFYCVDLGGGTLAPLARLPHVGGVAGRLEPDRIRRTVREVAAQLDRRERLFAERRIDSAAEMRRQHAAGLLPELPAADVVLVVDNHPVLRAEHEELADVVGDLAGRGLAYGVHLVLTAGRWSDLRMQLQAAIGSRLELALIDPVDSSISRRAADQVRVGTPGRCLVEGGLVGHVALPRVDGVADPDTAQAGLDALAGRVVAGWAGPRVPEIRLLPPLLRLDELAPAGPADRAVRLGVDETELRTVPLDLLGADQHLLVLGDAGSGRTNALRLVVRDLTSRLTDDEVVFAVMDVRRTLLDAVPDDYLGAYAGTSTAAAVLARNLAAELRGRLPGDDVTAGALRDRSWWSGPEIVVLCDDQDLLSDGAPGPLAPFLEFLPQSRDLGFHLVVARRAGGAGRALYEPVLQRAKEVGAAALLLSGDRQEGQLWPRTYLSAQPPGRGTLVRRGRPNVLVQTAYAE